MRVVKFGLAQALEKADLEHGGGQEDARQQRMSNSGDCHKDKKSISPIASEKRAVFGCRKQQRKLQNCTNEAGMSMKTKDRC